VWICFQKSRENSIKSYLNKYSKHFCNFLYTTEVLLYLMLINSTYSPFLLLSLFPGPANARARTFHRCEISDLASQFCTPPRPSPSHLLGCSRSKTSVSHPLQTYAGAPSCWYTFDGLCRQEYLLRVLEFHFRKRLCRWHLPVPSSQLTANDITPLAYRKAVLEVDFDNSLRIFTLPLRNFSRVDHAVQSKLFPVREGNVVFQSGLCIYPKTQYYPFSHYHCCSMLYLLDTIRTKIILLQCFLDCFHWRHIVGGRQPARIVFCYSNEVSLSLHSKCYS
jgi:hypothetical protein